MDKISEEKLRELAGHPFYRAMPTEAINKRAIDFKPSFVVASNAKSLTLYYYENGCYQVTISAAIFASHFLQDIDLLWRSIQDIITCFPPQAEENVMEALIDTSAAEVERLKEILANKPQALHTLHFFPWHQLTSHNAVPNPRYSQVYMAEMASLIQTVCREQFPTFGITCSIAYDLKAPNTFEENYGTVEFKVSVEKARWLTDFIYEVFPQDDKKCLREEHEVIWQLPTLMPYPVLVRLCKYLDIHAMAQNQQDRFHKWLGDFCTNHYLISPRQQKLYATEQDMRTYFQCCSQHYKAGVAAMDTQWDKAITEKNQKQAQTFNELGKYFRERQLVTQQLEAKVLNKINPDFPPEFTLGGL